MISKIRRVVTGVNEKGESVIMFDGEAQNVFLFPTLSGAAVTDLWVTGEVPVDNTGNADQGARPFKHDTDPCGTIFRIVEIPSEKRLLFDAEAQAAMEKAMDAMGSKHKATTEERNKHATMHMTDSVDYLVVLAGELTMIMDVGEVTLKPGDCIVQRGTRHGWANRGDMPVLLAAVLIDAQHIAGH
jgi:mannose-6-phosphate isomerase-like protein (cupin superfamily)